MTGILYEHPLNERIRSYLRLEHLFNQLNLSIECQLTVSHQSFFNALFAILDTLERNDIRGDLIKDLEKLEQSLLLWSKAPDVDTTVLEENLRQTVALTARLKNKQPDWWQLKEDKFLASLKQRFAIQGGSACFDLPQLHYWLNQSIQRTKQEVEQWQQLLKQISDALAIILKFIRQKSPFETITTDSGFYQDNGEGLLLLRIKIAEHAHYYPSISGNRFRYSIRFMLPCQESGRKYMSEATEFLLARC